jgi:DNA-binding NtrC family response regulator
VTKPFDMTQLLARLTRILPPARMEAAADAFLGVSPLAKRIQEAVRHAAVHETNVLIRGAAGTGKQATARRIHALSDVAHLPLVIVNFARDDAPMVNLATAVDRSNGGMIFLNAVDRADASAQDALLREIDRSPATRWIGAASPSLDAVVNGGGFRADLYFALASRIIDLPPLAERPDDAAWMAEDTFKRLNARRAKPVRGLAEATVEAIRAHSWPGNGRELRSRLARAIEHADSDWIQPVDVFPERQSDGPFPSLADVRDTAERAHIVAALARTDGQIMEAAKLLGISRTTLWEKMQRFGI